MGAFCALFSFENGFPRQLKQPVPVGRQGLRLELTGWEWLRGWRAVDKKTSAIALRSTGNSRVWCRGTTVVERSLVHPPGILRRCDILVARGGRGRAVGVWWTRMSTLRDSSEARHRFASLRLPSLGQTFDFPKLRSAYRAGFPVARSHGDSIYFQCRAVLPERE